METESIEQTFDNYMKGKVDNREKKLELVAKSKIPVNTAKIFRKTYEELVKSGFSKEEAITILCSGAIEI